MRYDPSLLDEIRARIPVSSVVGRRVKLAKKGREWMGLSPFNAEKTPSFTVNDQKGFYHCFSSGKHGDIFTFLIETEGLTFPEAVERLAQEAGVNLPQRSAQDDARLEARAGLIEACEAACHFFETQLGTREGAKARTVLAERMLSIATQKKFRIGYAPASRHALKEYLTGLGFTVDVLVEAGLLIGGEDIPVAYDRFRERLMFPILDSKERVVAFGGRALAKDAQPKYLNSPETPLFHKGSTLYHLAYARKAAHQGQPLIVVEGYVDVIACVQAGFVGAVAPLGTALTENQLQLLWRFCDEPVLALDGDKAGIKAAYRAAHLALPLLQPGKSIRVAFLPEGLDPDDLIRTRGREAMETALASARPLVDVLFAQLLQENDTSTPEKRAMVDASARQLAKSIQDETVRKYYGQALSDKLSETFASSPRLDNPRAYPPKRSVQGRGKRIPYGFDNGSSAPASESLKRSPMMRSSRLPRREAVLLLCLVNHPSLLHSLTDTLSDLSFSLKELDSFAATLLHLSAEGVDDPNTLRSHLQNSDQADVLNRLEKMLHDLPAEWWVKPDTARVDAETGFRQVLNLHLRVVHLRKELKSLELQLGENATEDNFRALNALREELHSLDGVEAQLAGFGVSSGRVVSSEL